MTQTDHRPSEAQRKAAADWVARLGGAPDEGDWLAFGRWLDAEPGHRRAYDEMLAVSLEIDRRAEALTEALEQAPRARPRDQDRRRTLWWSAGLLSVAAAAVTFAALNPKRGPERTVYATAKGERREVALADGTRVALNADTTLSVVLARDRREVVLTSGEAAFQVTHDADRPFTVAVGDRVLRDIGTEFDVVRQNGRIAVTVREGMVAVLAAGDESRPLTLGPGGRLEHREGSPDSTVLAVDADDAFSWRAGRLIYRDRRLSEVAADLNRYGQDEVRVSPAAADLRFTGVLTIDDQSAMVDRLTKLVPVAASRRKDGAILLSELNSTR